MGITTQYLMIAACAACIFQGRSLRMRQGESDCGLHGVVMLAQLDKDFVENGLFKNWFLLAKPILEKQDVSLVFDTFGDKQVDAYLKSFDMGGLSYRTMAEVMACTDDPSTHRSRVGPYGSQSYKDMMQNRPGYITRILKLGHDVFQYDVDTAWKKNPFSAIKEAGIHDVYVTRDFKGGLYCGCFLYFRHTENSIAFTQLWAASIQVKDHGNQAGLNRVLKSGSADADVHVLPRDQFPSGNPEDRKYADNATVVHANWINGIKKKVKYMKDLGVWQLEEGEVYEEGEEDEAVD